MPWYRCLVQVVKEMGILEVVLLGVYRVCLVS